MHNRFISIITVLALLTSLALPKSHAMMDMNGIQSQSMASEHCADMDMPDSIENNNQSPDCCQDCMCLFTCNNASYSHIFVFNNFNFTSQQQVIDAYEYFYSEPTQDFFIPPKIS